MKSTKCIFFGILVNTFRKVNTHTHARMHAHTYTHTHTHTHTPLKDLTENLKNLIGLSTAMTMSFHSLCLAFYFIHKLFTITIITLSNINDSIFFVFNLYHSLGIFSRRQIDDIFLIFPRKQDLTLHANCLLLRRQLAWNVKSCFLGKVRKIFQNVFCWKFYPEC